MREIFSKYGNIFTKTEEKCLKFQKNLLAQVANVPFRYITAFAENIATFGRGVECECDGEREFQ